MKKIPTIFIRDEENRKLVTREPNPACQWVFDCEGAPTRKYDGTCCMISGDGYFKRREIKPGGQIPTDFREEMADPVTGKRVGWVPVDPSNPADRYHLEALRQGLPHGTYELVGPKIQGNPEGTAIHYLKKHAEAHIYDGVPRDFDGLRAWIANMDIEGLVFHHPDGRMAKIKKRDFGLMRKPG
jgi:hypothetical protein